MNRRPSLLHGVGRLAVATLAAALLAACAGPRVQRMPQAPRTLAHVSSSAGETGPGVSATKASRDIVLPSYVVVRRYDDVFREDDRNVPVTVEYGWDYLRRSAIERVYARGSDTLRSERAIAGLTLNVSDAELELAFALVREEPQLATVLSQPQLNFYGGFSYEEADDPDCGAGSRCIHVIISAGDGQRAVAHSIVDLATRRVVHPFYAPPPEAGEMS